jgi:hypothetical protein
MTGEVFWHNQDLCIRNFSLKVSVGRGGFGRVPSYHQVWKTIYKPNGNEYGLKKMSKLR